MKVLCARLGTLVRKTLRSLQNNGVMPTLKKIFRRVSGKNWIPEDEDGLFAVRDYSDTEDRLWHAPGSAVRQPYDGMVSVVIPTYNGEDELPPLLELLKRQREIGKIELIIVDSGSSDETRAIAERMGEKLVCITQEEFSHSYSRKLGAKQAEGEYLLFMTQDAMPDGEDWLIRLMQPALRDGAAAVSCYERPRPDADLFSRIAAWVWIRVMSGSTDRLTELPEDMAYDSLRRCAQLSDNACLVRRDVYEKLGGHRGAYAEDLDLGIRLLKAGYRLGILSSVAVLHSHSRNPLYYFKRAMVDAISISGMFEDFRMDSIDLYSAVSRIALAACANLLFLNALSDTKEAETPQELCRRTREIYNRNITMLRRKNASEIENFLQTHRAALDPSVQELIEELWQLGKSGYHFEPVLAISQARYIMHNLCPYLSAEGLAAEERIKAEMPLMLWQYFGQSAGYTASACFLNAPDTEGKMERFIKKYQAGV